MYQFLLRTTMKKPSLVLFAFILTALSVKSQSNVIKVQSCSNDLIKTQVDSLKKLYSDDGFILMKEASISMESEYEMPVIVPLNEGSLYQFVFIGDYTSRLYEVRMYDWNEKQVYYKQNKWGEIDGNVISYAYQPRFSEFHMMKPVQVNKQKKKNLCGYVMMFKKVK